MPEYLGRNIQTHISNLEILDLKFQASKFILPPQMSHILITSSIAIWKFVHFLFYFPCYFSSISNHIKSNNMQISHKNFLN